MKKVAVYALKRALKEGFLILRQSELEALDALPGWMTRLFTAMLRCSDYGTGKGETSYANLQALLTPIQPRSGPKHFVPDIQAIKKAVRLLEERCLLSRDKLHSQDQGRLLYLVMPRYEETRPKAELKPPTRTPANARKAPVNRVSEAAEGGTETPDSNPSSAAIFSHIKEGNLSTDGPLQPPEATTPPGPICIGAAGAADPKIGPPRGADNRPAGAGHAPQGFGGTRPFEFDSAYKAGAFAGPVQPGMTVSWYDRPIRMRQLSPIAPHAMAALGSLHAPPGGQNKDAPGASGRERALQAANALRRGARKTVLNGDARDFSDAKPAGDARTEAQDGA